MCVWVCVCVCVSVEPSRPTEEICPFMMLIMTPLQADIEIPIPRFFISERAEELQERRKMLSDITSTMEVPEKNKVRE